MVSFAVQKLFSLIRSHLFIFITLGYRSQKDLAVIYLRVFFLCVPLRVLYSVGLTFRSLIHLQFIFMHGVRECSNFILSNVAVQFPQHDLLKRFSFSPLYILASFVID